MKKLFLTIVLFSLVHFLFAEIPVGYYDSASGLSGDDLKSALHNIIDDHTEGSYDLLWTILPESDEDPNNSSNFILLYTGRSIAKTSSYPDYNREHVWAKSHGDFGTSAPAGTDAHHLRPTDVSVNSDRGNKDFDNGGSPHSEATECNWDSDSWEPRDAVKGDVARMMFYMVVRYEGDVSGEPDLELVDYITGSTSSPIFGKLSTLLEWHYNDPVDDVERHRNEVVYSYQDNRNPFIDHPEYVAQMWGGGGNLIPSISNIIINPEYPTSSDNVSITAEIKDNDGTIGSAELHWGVSSGSLINTISLINSTGDTYTTSTSIPSQADGTTIYFEIEATDNEPETNTSSEQSYKVSNNPTITILDEDFSSCPATGWKSYSISSSEDWSCSGGLIEINAYGSDDACNDWIISPAINLDSYSNEILTFTSWTRFTDSYNPPVTLKFSTNYSGSGDPSASNWNDLSVTWSPQDSQTTTSSGNIDLSSISGNNVYIAIQYISSGTGAGSSAWWKIDDFVVIGKNADSGNSFPVISDIAVIPTIPSSTENVSVSAKITDSDGSISSADIKWGTTSGSYTNTISMTNSGDDYSGVIPMQTNGTIIYFIIVAIDNESGSKQSSEYNYTVNNLPVISDIDINPENPTATENVTISATLKDADGSISSANIKWGTTSGSYTNTISMTALGDNYSGDIPAQSAASTIYFLIEATDNLTEKTDYSGNYSVSESTGLLKFSSEKLRVYPSPAREILHVELSDNESVKTLKLFNIAGEKVYEITNVNSSKISVNLNNLIKGIYFIHIKNDNKIFIRKIVIE